MMRRLICILVLALGLVPYTTNAVAQYSPLVFGIKAGLNFSSLSNDYSTRLHYQLGATLDYEITDNFYILSGLEFTVLGAKRKSQVLLDQVGSVKPSVAPMYIKIPLHLACKISLSDNTRLVFDTGPYIAIGVGGKTTASTQAGATKTIVETDYFGNNRATRFDTGLGMAMGIEVEDMIFKLGYDYGIINKKQIDGLKAKNKNIELTVGYKFR